MVKLQVEKLVGNSTDTHWAQAHAFVGGKKGSLLLVLELRGDSLVDLPMFGSEVIQRFHEEYYSRDEENVLEALKATINKVDGEVKDTVELAVIVGLAVEDALYVAGKGKVEAKLYREGKLYKLFEGEGEIDGLSGFIGRGDRLVLATGELVSIAEEGVWKGAFESESAQSAGETIAPIVHGKDDSSRMAGLIVFVFQDVAQEKVTSLAEMPSLVKVGTGLGAKVLKKLKLGKGEGGLYINREDKKKRNVILAMILLGLLVGSVGMGALKRSRVVKEREFVQVENAVNQNLIEAEASGAINPERSRYLIEGSYGMVRDYQAKISDKGFETKALTLLASIEQAERQILKKTETSPNVFMDLALVLPGATGKVMSMGKDGTLFVLDEKSGNILGVHLEDKSSFVLEGGRGAWGNAVSIVADDEEVLLVSEKGVMSKPIEEGEVKVAIEPDEEWKKIQYLEVFAGNVYLLDTEQGEIWKYPILDDGYGSRRRWLGKGIILDLSKVVDMQVDGDIWLLTTSGKLERYSRGVPVDFKLQGVGEKLSDPVAVFTKDEKVYVLERGNKRVVVFDGSGVLQKQYLSEEFGEATALVVEEGKAFVLAGAKIYSFELE